MTSPQKRKGDAFERAVRDHLQACGVTAERIPAGATLDRGDLWTPFAAVQTKNHKRIDLGPWLSETCEQQANAEKSLHLLVVKRRQKPVGEAFAVMTLDQAAQLLARIENPPAERRPLSTEYLYELHDQRFAGHDDPRPWRFCQEDLVRLSHWLSVAAHGTILDDDGQVRPDAMLIGHRLELDPHAPAVFGESAP